MEDAATNPFGDNQLYLSPMPLGKLSNTFPTISDLDINQITVQTRVAPRQVPTGFQRGTQSIGNSNVRIDNSNNRIIISDGTTDRVIIGMAVDGF